MATLTKRNGRHIIQLLDEGKRKTLSLPPVKDGAANIILGHVEHLHAAKVANQAPPADTLKWLAGIGDVFHGRLIRAGLIKPRETKQVTALGEMVDRYIATRTDLKPRSKKNLRHVRESLVTFFGEFADVRTINRAMARDYSRNLKLRDALTPLSTATVATHIKKARQIFRDAADRKLIEENPFIGIKPGSQVNSDRNEYVPVADVLKVIDVCPDDEWRLVFALARFGGLRIPSELRGLKWSDIDWAKDRMVIRSPKTEHHQGKGKRTIPLFEELRPYLEKQKASAAPEEDRIIVKLGGENIRQEAGRIIEKSGVVQWPRVFQNLRASRETDLAAMFPLHVACAWIGNSKLVATKHYLQVTDDDFDLASGKRCKNVVGNNPINGAETPMSWPDGSFNANIDGVRSLSGCVSFKDIRQNLDFSSKALQKQIRRLKQAAKVMRRRDIRFFRLGVALARTPSHQIFSRPGRGILLSKGGAK